jgi:hypothetical protein
MEAVKRPTTLNLDEIHALLQKHAGEYYVICEDPTQLRNNWKYPRQGQQRALKGGKFVASFHEQRKSKPSVQFFAQIQGCVYRFHLQVEAALCRFHSDEARNHYNFVLAEVDLRTLQGCDPATVIPFNHWKVFTTTLFNQSTDQPIPVGMTPNHQQDFLQALVPTPPSAPFPTRRADLPTENDLLAVTHSLSSFSAYEHLFTKAELEQIVAEELARAARQIEEERHRAAAAQRQQALTTLRAEAMKAATEHLRSKDGFIVREPSRDATAVSNEHDNIMQHATTTFNAVSNQQLASPEIKQEDPNRNAEEVNSA